MSWPLMWPYSNLQEPEDKFIIVYSVSGTLQS